jgi:quinol monooxygenase YgiN
MSVDRGLLVILEAQPGKEDELAAFLTQAQPLAATEPGTVTWYAFKLSDTTFGIFDTFSDEAGRQAHLNGPIAAALGQAGPGLLAKDPDIQRRSQRYCGARRLSAYQPSCTPAGPGSTPELCS